MNYLNSIQNKVIEFAKKNKEQGEVKVILASNNKAVSEAIFSQDYEFSQCQVRLDITYVEFDNGKPEALAGYGSIKPMLIVLCEYKAESLERSRLICEASCRDFDKDEFCHILMEDKLFAMRDSRSNLGSNMMFWRAGGGYTSNINEADLFTLEAAQRQHNCRHSDVPVLLSKLKEKASSAVDCQYLPSEDNYKPNSPYVIQKTGVWNGNDIAFVVDLAGGTSYDYNKAHVFDEKEAFHFVSSDISNANYQIWSKSDIDKIVRSSVAAMHFDKQTMMLDAGIVENAPPKPKPERYNCHNCGKFVSFETYYGTCYHGNPCPKCED